MSNPKQVATVGRKMVDLAKGTAAWLGLGACTAVSGTAMWKMYNGEGLLNPAIHGVMGAKVARAMESGGVWAAGQQFIAGDDHAVSNVVNQASAKAGACWDKMLGRTTDGPQNVPTQQYAMQSYPVGIDNMPMLGYDNPAYQQLYQVQSGQLAAQQAYAQQFGMQPYNYQQQASGGNFISNLFKGLFSGNSILNYLPIIPAAFMLFGHGGFMGKAAGLSIAYLLSKQLLNNPQNNIVNQQYVSQQALQEAQRQRYLQQFQRYPQQPSVVAPEYQMPQEDAPVVHRGMRI